MSSLFSFCFIVVLSLLFLCSVDCRVSSPLLNVRRAHAPAKKAETCPGTPHTKHVVSSNKPATCVIARLYEPTLFCFIDLVIGQPIVDAFEVSPTHNQTFGMIFQIGADFNMEYALTCKVNDSLFAQSPKVIFNIGAVGPASPNIQVNNQFGAVGSWVSTGVGENYHVQFSETDEDENDN